MCALTLVVGCGKSVPDCSDSDTKELVLQIFNEHHAVTKALVHSIENIREVDENDKTGSYTCEAEIYTTYSAARAEAEVAAADVAYNDAKVAKVEADADANAARVDVTKAQDAYKAASAARKIIEDAHYNSLVDAQRGVRGDGDYKAAIAAADPDYVAKSTDAAAVLMAANEAVEKALNDPKYVAATQKATVASQKASDAYFRADSAHRDVDAKEVDMTVLNRSAVKYTTELTSEGKLYVTLR